MRRTIASVACLGLALGTTSAVAAEERPVRSGFTLELGLGAAVTSVTRELSSCFGSTTGGTGCSDTSDTDVYAGIAPLSLGIGAFLSRDVALTLRTSATGYFRSSDLWLNSFFGPAVQYWPTDYLALGGGAGLGVFGPDPALARSSRDPKAGFALSLRAGLDPFALREHSFRISLEVLPAFYEGSRVIGTALVVEWQLL